MSALQGLLRYPCQTPYHTPFPILKNPRNVSAILRRTWKHQLSLYGLTANHRNYSSTAHGKHLCIRIYPLLCKLAMSYLFSGGIYAIIYHALAGKPGANVALSRWPPCTGKKKIHGNFTQPLRHKERISNKEANLINTEKKENVVSISELLGDLSLPWPRRYRQSFAVSSLWYCACKRKAWWTGAPFCE